MHESDTELIRRVRDHEVAALADYIDQTRHQLLAFIQRRLGAALRTKIEVDDVFQDVSAEAVRSLATVELDSRDPFSWLCQIVERKIVDAHRFHFGAQKRSAERERSLDRPGSRSRQAKFIDLLVVSMTTPSQAFSRNAREARLFDALGALPEDQREALRLRYVENLPSKQIAAQLGKSDAAVRVTLTRAIKRLQAILGDE